VHQTAGVGLNLLILSAAVWRISFLLVEEDGPFDVFDRLRKLAGIRYDINGERIYISDAPLWRLSLAEVFNCIYCMSVWVGILFAILYYSSEFLAVALTVPFALSTGAIAINRLCNHGKS